MLYYKKQSENTFQKNCFKLKKLFLQLIQNQIKLTLTTNLFNCIACLEILVKRINNNFSIGYLIRKKKIALSENGIKWAIKTVNHTLKYDVRLMISM